MMETQRIDISIIVPLYNEEESVKLLYDSLSRTMGSLNLNYEILFVDDGSSDQTFEIIKNIAQQQPELRVIKFRQNCGQTPAMAAGIDYARGEVLITMDGDLQNDPEDIPVLFRKINEGYDIVVGWRHKRQDKLLTRKIPSRIANWLIGKVTGIPIKDNGCSLKAYRAAMIKHIPLYSEMHRFIPAMTSIAGAKVSEIKVNHRARQFGTTKYGLSRIYKVLLDLISIKTIISVSPRPMIGFGLVAMIAAVLSFLMFLVSIINAFWAPQQSLVVLMGSSMLFGSLSIFLLVCGMICELIYKTGNLNMAKLSQFTAIQDFLPENEQVRIDEYE